VSIIIACHNEQDTIYETIKYLAQSPYPNVIDLIVVDNASADNTSAEVERAFAAFGQPGLRCRCLLEPRMGKHNALNCGLACVATPYVLTLDSDTLLYGDAVRELVAHMVIENRTKAVGAVAGAVFVRNSRKNLLTRLQEWDYFLSIASVKRSQGLFQSTLVAQGAWSIYDTALLKQLGGWSDAIGEDIVLSWDILNAGYVVQYEPQSVSFTNVPERLHVFQRQRSRWARGMIEGLRHRAPWKYPSRSARFLIASDYLLFFIDLGVVVMLLAGIIPALLFHFFLIAGPWTLLTLPLNIVMFGILLIKERTRVFKAMGLRIRKHYFSLAIFLVAYQFLMSPISIIGYFEELFHVRRAWR
jgi:biofilm PGA synthesis N-glycosyltransferase PgaC